MPDKFSQIWNFHGNNHSELVFKEEEDSAWTARSIARELIPLMALWAGEGEAQLS